MIERETSTGAIEDVAPVPISGSENRFHSGVTLRFIILPLAALLIALLMGCASLWLFSRNNEFPLNYQPDETSKAAQIVDSPRRNFNHPLLMLESANLARRWFAVPEHFRDLVIAGRWTSATLSSIGVAAMASAGYWAYGYRGLLLSGSIVALCPPWLVYAHYFKEDASLASGIALAVLGMAWVVNAKSLWQQLIGSVVLGAGCAAAMSGKYVGVMIAPACLLAVFIAPGARWWRILLRLILFLAAAVAGLMTINARAFESFWPIKLQGLAVDRIQFDFDHAIGGHYGITLPRINLYCIDVTCRELMPHLWIFLLLGMVFFLIQRKVSRWGIVLAALLLSIGLTLCFDTIPFDRYALPLSVVLYFIAGQAMASVLESPRLGAVTKHLGLAVCIATVVVLQGMRCLNFDHQFGDDSRQRVRVWIAGNLPQGSTLAVESYTGMEEPDRWRFPQSELGMGIRGQDYAPNLADTPEQLAAENVDYVVVSSQAYERFFVRGIRSTPDQPGYVEHQRHFYEGLFARGNLVWSSIPSPPTDSFVNPEVRIYRIAQLR
jgi:hypothetical protein